MHLRFLIPLATLAVAATTPLTQAVTVQLTVTNHSPAGGAGLAPLWIGFHDGSFDSYDAGSAAASELEILAEVGDPGPLSAVFAAGGTLVPTGISQTGARVQWNTGLLAPGASQSVALELAADGSNGFLSYASMVLPSNDFFIANGDPQAFGLSSAFSTGTALFEIGLPGSINDAGTEINDFLFSAGNPFGPAGLPAGDAPGGNPEGGVVSAAAGDPYAGFLNAPGGFASGNLDFNDAALYPQGIASIELRVIPEPSTGIMLAGPVLAMAARRRRRG